MTWTPTTKPNTTFEAGRKVNSPNLILLAKAGVIISSTVGVNIAIKVGNESSVWTPNTKPTTIWA